MLVVHGDTTTGEKDRAYREIKHVETQKAGSQRLRERCVGHQLPPPPRVQHLPTPTAACLCAQLDNHPRRFPSTSIGYETPVDPHYASLESPFASLEREMPCTPLATKFAHCTWPASSDWLVSAAPPGRLASSGLETESDREVERKSLEW